MDFNEDDSICSIVRISGFDHFDWTGGDDEDTTLDNPVIKKSFTPQSLKSFKKELKVLCKEWDEEALRDEEEDSGYDRRIHRLAFAMAWTSHLQETAEKHLKTLGFTQFGPQEKLKHSGSKLSVWIIPIPEFIKAIDYNQ